MAKRMLSEYMFENNCSASTAISALYPQFGTVAFLEQSDSDRLIFKHLLNNSTPPAVALTESCKRLKVKKTFLRKFLQNGNCKKMNQLATAHAAKSGGKERVRLRVVGLESCVKKNLKTLLHREFSEDVFVDLNLRLESPDSKPQDRINLFLSKIHANMCDFAWICLNLKSKDLSPASGLQLEVKKTVRELTGVNRQVLAEFADIDSPEVFVAVDGRVNVRAPIGISPNELLGVGFFLLLKSRLSNGWIN